ncbi:hypothetical protein FYL81_14520, partial [Salmonella enterica subsp. enterica serovar Typhimurium]
KLPPVLQIYSIIRGSPSVSFTCSDAITDSNAFIREALRLYTDGQSLVKIILHPMRPQLR